MRKSGLYKFTELISQFYHVSVLYYCKTRWWSIRGIIYSFWAQMDIPWIINLSSFIICQCISGSHDQALLRKLIQSDRENIMLISAWFFFFFYLFSLAFKSRNPQHFQEIDENLRSRAGHEKTSAWVHPAVCRGIAVKQYDKLLARFVLFKRTEPDNKCILFLFRYMYAHK